MSLNWKDWTTPRYSTDDIVQKVAEAFEYFDDDIVVSTYHKSGTTLMQEMISCLILGPEKTKNTALLRRSPFIDYGHMPTDPMEEARTLPRPRVLKTHLPPAFHMRHLSDQSPDAGPKNVIVIRNPKDVLVSAFHHFNGTKKFDGKPIPDNFTEYWRKAIFQPASLSHHDIFDFSRSWWSFKDHPRVLVLFYEDILRNKPDQVRKLAKFLGVELTEELLKATLDLTSFQTMRENPNVNYSITEEAKNHWKPGFNFIRKGEIGDWKNHFTVAENEEFDRYIADRLRDCDLRFTFE